MGWLRDLLQRFEKAEARFYASPWSTGIWLVFCGAWLVWAYLNGEDVGWDGVATMGAGAIALATIRRLPPIRLRKRRRWF